MNYFPRIRHIDDVLPVVQGDPAFRVVEKDSGHTFINYNHMGSDVFPPLVTDEEWERCGDEYESHCLSESDQYARLRRECRGIAFDTTTGMLVSRPFHKFFNAGERDEVAIDKLPFDRPHVVMDKLDGSMIRPLPVRDGFIWGTKMGDTDVAALAQEFVAKNSNYESAAWAALQKGWTIIFEFVSRRNRIVVDYPEENLILLAARDTFLGHYIGREELEDFATEFGLPIVKVYPSGTNAAQFVADVRASSEIDEGVVVQFETDYVKVKTEIYSDLHAAKDKMATERRLLSVVLEDNVDDLLPLLPEEDRDALLAYVDAFWNEANGLAADIEELYKMARNGYETKKDFAISGKLADQQHYRGLIFGLWDGKIEDANAAAMQVINGGLSSETKWQEMKQKFGFNTEWREEELEE